MEKSWGENPEYTISSFVNWTHWAIPLALDWWAISGFKKNKRGCNYRTVTVKFLCFGIEFGKWNSCKE